MAEATGLAQALVSEALEANAEVEAILESQPARRAADKAAGARKLLDRANAAQARAEQTAINAACVHSAAARLMPLPPSQVGGATATTSSVPPSPAAPAGAASPGGGQSPAAAAAAAPPQGGAASMPSSSSAAAAAAAAQPQPLYNYRALQLWLLRCCQTLKGGLRDKPGKPVDYYHTCYCLSGLAAAQHYLRSPPAAASAGGSLLGPPDSNVLQRPDPLVNVVAAKLAAAHKYFDAQPAL